MSAYVIYLITNTITGVQYIGQTNNLKKRMSTHRRAVGETLLARAIRKYGWDAFDVDVVFEHDDQVFVRDVMEVRFIAWYDTYENGYNMTIGGDGVIGVPCSPERKLAVSKRHTGKTQSEETKRLISEAKKGRKLSPEHRRKLSEAKKGKKRGPHSEETRRKMREAWVRRKAEAS